jgi:hypothetical protein
MNDVIYLGFLGLAIWKLMDLGRVGYVGMVGLRTSLGTRSRRVTDVSDLKLTPPPTTRQLIEALQQLGFQRLGEAQLKLPFRTVSTTWVLVDANNRVQAETMGRRVSFSSFFHDDVLVVTDYPNGEHIDTPTYQSHTVTTNVSDAYAYHLKQVAKFGQEYGVPNSIRTMIDYYRGETMGRVYPYARRKLRRFICIESVRLAMFGIGVFALVLECLLFWYRPSSLPANLHVLRENAEIIMMVFTLLVFFIPDAFAHWMIGRTYRNSADR